GEDSKAVDKKQKDKSKALDTKKAQSKTLSKKLESKDETLLESAQESAINQTQSVQSRSSNVAEVDSYMKYVYTLITQASMRQSALKNATIKGEVSLIFSIDTQGMIKNIYIRKSSQNSQIDEVAISTIKSIEKELKKPSKEYTMSVTLGVGERKHR
ncbi:MAG: TonB family protein, partial [Helicobacter japonicus]|nr:TonB family protein [Helicobacter japonicus]